MILVFFLFLGLAALPGLAIWSMESIPVKLRAVLVTAALSASCLAVIHNFLKRLGMNYSGIGVRFPKRPELRRDALFFFAGTAACLLWFNLYSWGFKVLLPAAYARLDALKHTGYIQVLADWGRAGGFYGAAALWGGMLLLVAIEELAFRGVIFNYLRREHTFKEALLWSSALFTLAHLNPYNFPISFVVGLILATLYAKSGGLTVPILVHLTYNLSLIYLGRYLH